jgi:hypothetical protein
MPAAQTKRQNFDVTPDQEAEIAWLREALGAATAKDTLLRAVRIAAVLSREAQCGREVLVRDRSGATERLIIPELERPHAGGWTFLVERPHPWRRQLYVKGSKLSAAQVWRDMVANSQAEAEAAAEWEIPVEAVREAVLYCTENRALIAAEAREERHRAAASGVRLAPAR